MPGEERPVPRPPGPTAPDVLQVAPAEAPAAAPAPRARPPAGAAFAGGIPEGQYLGLAAGERLELSDGLRLAEPTRQAVFVGRGELVVMDHVHGHGHRMRHYRLPGSAEEDGRPVVSGIVVAVIRQKPVGWKSLGSHFLVFLNAAGVRVGEIDNSMDYGSRGAGTWEFNSEELRALCAAAGLTFGIEVCATPDDFVAKHPEWTPPEFEFETEHRSTERVREWGLAVLLGIPIAVGFLVTGLYFVLVGPVGWIVAGLELLGIAVVMVLTAWGHSRWRMRRSLGRRSGT